MWQPLPNEPPGCTTGPRHSTDAVRRVNSCALLFYVIRSDGLYILCVSTYLCVLWFMLLPWKVYRVLWSVISLWCMINHLLSWVCLRWEVVYLPSYVGYCFQFCHVLTSLALLRKHIQYWWFNNEILSCAGVFGYVCRRPHHCLRRPT